MFQENTEQYSSVMVNAEQNREMLSKILLLLIHIWKPQKAKLTGTKAVPRVATDIVQQQKKMLWIISNQHFNLALNLI